jgi:type II secretory pathway pseudopilin PulG
VTAAIAPSLVGVMGAGLLVFVRNDLEAVVEVKQGQRAFNLADAGAQAARRELLSQPDPGLYDVNGTDNSVWAYARQGDAPTKTLDMEEGTATITIQYLSPSTSERQAGQADFAPESLPSGQIDYPDGRDYFKVISEGQAGEARRRVEAIYYTADLGVPKGFSTPQRI